MEVEQLGLFDLAALDRLGLVLVEFGDRPATRRAGRRDPQRPWVVQGALREVGFHRLVRLAQARKVEPVRLVIALERGTRTIACVRRVRQRDGLSIRPAARVQADDQLFADIEQVRVGTLLADDHERAIGQFLDLLLRVCQQRNVRVIDRTTDRVARRVPPIEPDWPLGVQFRERHPGHELGLGCALAP